MGILIEPPKPPYQTDCGIVTKTGKCYVAQLIHFNQRFHAKHPVPDRWKLLAMQVSGGKWVKTTGWMDFDRVLRWEVLKVQERSEDGKHGKF